jgi:hypothetical protein
MFDLKNLYIYFIFHQLNQVFLINAMNINIFFKHSKFIGNPAIKVFLFF